ncbi:MAG: hypothetical protein ACTSWA_01960 [Candidatus Thorarchaeota archaeon]
MTKEVSPVISGLAQKDDEIRVAVHEIIDKIKEFEKDGEDMSLFNPFVSDEGNKYAEQVSEISKFSLNMINSSLWTPPEIAESLRGMINEDYEKILVKEGHSDEDAKKIANHERKRMDSLIALAKGGHEIHWNGFIYLALATAIYSYCGVFVDHYIQIIAKTDERKKLLLSLIDEKNEYKSFRNAIRNDTYHRMITILKPYNLDALLEEQVRGINIDKYQQGFQALKKWRDAGAHKFPLLDPSDFPWVEHQKRMKELRGESIEAKSRVLNSKEIEEHIASMEADNGTLTEEEKDEIRQTLSSSSKLNPFINSLDELVTELIPGYSLIFQIPIIATVYPAVFERVCIVLEEILTKLGH